MTEHDQVNQPHAEQSQSVESRSLFHRCLQKLKEKDEVGQLMKAIEKKVSLNSRRRPLNLRLLRAFRGETQKAFIATQGFPYMSDSHYGNIESERREARLTDAEARKIENINNLPIGWLDRDNGCAIFLSHDEFEFMQLIRQTPQEVQMAVVTLCKHIANTVTILPGTNEGRQ
jgi:hypothetical protein